MELPTGVHALSLEIESDDGARQYHPTAVETDHGVILVDSGLPGTFDELAGTFDDAGFDVDDISVLLLTHQDPDHAGSASVAAERSDALVAAHEADAPYIDGRQEPIKSQGDRYPPVPVDVSLVDGVRFRTRAGEMRVVATPGHTPGHVSLYFPDQRLLLAADALVSEEGLAGPKPQYTPDMDRAAESVDALAELDVSQVVCFHGGPVVATSDDIRDIYESLTG